MADHAGVSTLATSAVAAPDVALRARITTLLDTVGAHLDEPLSEQKRAQLDAGDTGWTAVLVGDPEALDDRDPSVARTAPLRGFAHVRWDPPGHVPRASAELVVATDDFDADAVGEALLAGVREAVAEAGGGTLFLWTHHTDDPAATVAGRAGLRVARELLLLGRPLVDRTEVAAPPADVRIATYRQGTDDDALLAVNNAAFSDHPEQGGMTAADLALRSRLPWFRADDVLLAWRGQEPVGLHWTKVAEDGSGEVYVIGVHPDAQGLGLGRLLLHAGLAHLHDRGCRSVALHVEGDNTGAIGLYRAEGFVTAARHLCYAEELPPASTSRSAS